MSPEEDPDETIFVLRDNEETVVAPRAGTRRRREEPEETEAADPAETAASDLDETLMADRAARSASASAPEETIAAPRVAQPLPRESSTSRSGSVAPPVEEPRTGSSKGPRRIRQDSLDPVRRVNPAPWNTEVRAEPGVRPGLPVPYGPRPDIADGVPLDIDAVHRRIGPPPITAAPPPPVDRSALPSTRRRARRRNAVTVAAFGGVLLVSVTGLVVVWQLAVA